MDLGILRILVLMFRQLVLVWIFLIIIVASANFSPGPKTPVVDKQIENASLVNMAKNFETSIVMITGMKQNSPQMLFNFENFGTYMTMGTGFIVSSDGDILTNKHVVEDLSAKYQVTTNNGDKYTVLDIYRDPNNDIAVIKIDPTQHADNKLIAINLGESNNIKIGEAVATVGNNPGQLQKSVKTGVISGLGYRVIADNPYLNSREKLNNVIQTDLDLVPGNSGSPLIDDSGNVIGINTATATSFSSQSFAIPIDPAKTFLNSVPQ